MMTTLARPTHPESRPPIKRWTAAEFDRLVELGAFDGQRVELINGELLEALPMNDAHAQTVQLVQYALLPIFPPTTHNIRIQLPMRLTSGDRPSPDIVVVLGTPRQVARHPATALLVIEVADTTLEFDRSEKAELYARNLLADYWIVNIQGRCVEVHRRAIRDADRGRCEEIRPVFETDSLSPLAAQDAIIRVSDLLP